MSGILTGENILKKKFIIILFFIFIISGLSIEGWSSGIFSTGIGIGVSGDTGGLDSTMAYINSEMRKFQITNPGIEVSEIDNLYSPVAGLNFSYIYNYAIFKAGMEYSGNFFFLRKGSLGSNNIEISYERFTIPVSMGIVIPFDVKNRFYLAGGINYSYANLQIKQSNPDPAWILSDKKYTFADDIMGLHVKAGAEVIFYKNYSLVIEATKFFGFKKTAKSEENNGEFYHRLDAFQITAGINYSVNM